MSVRQRVYSVYLASLAAVFATNLLAHQLPFSDGWRFAAWMGLWFGSIAVLSRWARCPHCGTRLLGYGLRPDVDEFAYIRCQECRRRFDCREGPDPEISDEALADGDPVLLAAYREQSEEMNRLIRARRDPAAREALLADLLREEQQCEAELRRLQAAASGERELAEFMRHRREGIRQEIAELRRQR
jgi:hypothetical protein